MVVSCSVSALPVLLSVRMRRVPTSQCLSNRSAAEFDAGHAKKREENSTVQEKLEWCVECGEAWTGRGCGEGPARKKRGLAENGLVLTSRSDPFGLSQAEAFGNSLADSVSFRFPSWLSLDGAPLLR